MSQQGIQANQREPSAASDWCRSPELTFFQERFRRLEITPVFQCDHLLRRRNADTMRVEFHTENSQRIDSDPDSSASP
jgi:hypothetical protein